MMDKMFMPLLPTTWMIRHCDGLEGYYNEFWVILYKGFPVGRPLDSREEADKIISWVTSVNQEEFDEPWKALHKRRYL